MKNLSYADSLRLLDEALKQYKHLLEKLATGNRESANEDLLNIIVLLLKALLMLNNYPALGIADPTYLAAIATDRNVLTLQQYGKIVETILNLKMGIFKEEFLNTVKVLVEEASKRDPLIRLQTSLTKY